MGYYDIFDLFENRGWRERSRIEDGELVLLEGALICPRCLRPLTRARVKEEGKVRCPHCTETFRPDDACR